MCPDFCNTPYTLRASFLSSVWKVCAWWFLCVRRCIERLRVVKISTGGFFDAICHFLYLRIILHIPIHLLCEWGLFWLQHADEQSFSVSCRLWPSHRWLGQGFDENVSSRESKADHCRTIRIRTEFSGRNPSKLGSRVWSNLKIFVYLLSLIN